MRKSLTYLAAGIVNIASLLPVEGCGSNSGISFGTNVDTNIQSPSIMSNVRTNIEDFIDSQETIYVVIGAGATIGDQQAAFEIRQRLDAEIQAKYAPQTLRTEMQRDIHITQPYNTHAILVGTEQTNMLIPQVRAYLEPADRFMPADTGVIEGYNLPSGKKLVVATGLNMVDVLRAGRAISQYDQTINGNTFDVDGTIIYSTGQVTSLQTTVHKK